MFNKGYNMVVYDKNGKKMIIGKLIELLCDLTHQQFMVRVATWVSILTFHNF
jgi:hypothetical protein